jgi:hypothetical protein
VTGVCASCRNPVREVQIMDAVRAVLIQDPACLLWRNEIGSSTHFPNGTPRKGPIRYGVCNPGGADLLGIYGFAPSARSLTAADLLERHGFLDVALRIRTRAGGRYLAVECKTPRGRQSPDQINFERWITARGGVYALVRSAADAADLLAALRASAPLPPHLRGEGSQQSPEQHTTP